jgi:glucose/arabinose dehydrogenase
MSQLVSRLTIVALAVVTQGCSSRPEPPDGAPTASTPQGSCTALESRAANAPGQQPAFAGQTRACAVTGPEPVVTVIARGLEHPWAVEPLPDGSFLVTERPGRMRVVTAAGVVGAPLSGLPPVDAGGQGGLLDVALSPAFSTDRTIFWSYSEPRDGGNATSVARGVLAPDGQSLSDVRVIFRAMPTYDGSMHFGSRVVPGPDGMLYVTLGERSDRSMRAQAQQPSSHMGKIVRISPDGGIPGDNPLAGQAGARAEIWTLGHRNVQAAAFDESGRLWVVEHGTRGGDELNLIVRGRNYGWPVQAYGEEYSGSPISGASTVVPGMEQPAYYWDPVIAPSGAQFYSGGASAAWRGNLFVGSLKDMQLVRLVLANGRVAGEQRLLGDRRHRIRDVRQGPDGALYLVTDMSDGELWRVTTQ